MKYINRYYENHDTLIKVLSIVKSNEGKLFVCLAFSFHHKVHSMLVMTKKEFKKYFKNNELDPEGWDNTAINAKDLLTT